MNINRDVYYIDDIAKSEPNGGNKAKSDIKKIFEKKGFRKLDLSIKAEKRFLKILTKVLLPIKLFFKCLCLRNNNIVFIQIPTYSLLFCSPVLFLMKRIIKFKMIIVIHDIEKLRNIYKFPAFFLKHEDKYLELSDAIICHNKAMKNYLVGRGILERKVFVINIFDYILESDNGTYISTPYNKYVVNIAGSLDVRRSPYVYKLLNANNKGIEWKVYGPYYNENMVHSNLNSYKGCYPSNEIPYHLTEGWGLIWDGESINSCTGKYGEYIKYINQHKASLYIASGLPVIIWENAGLADFIKENHIGITISNLTTLKEQIDHVSDELYVEMKENVMKVREKIINGEYADKVINEAATWLRG